MKIKPKVLILDLDGTVVPLVRDYMGVPSKRVMKSIADARKRGVHVCIATGRPLKKALPLIEKLGISEPCIFADGAVIYDPSKHAFIEKRPLSLEKIDEVASRLEGLGAYIGLLNMDGEVPYAKGMDISDGTGIIVSGGDAVDIDRMYARIRDIDAVIIRRIYSTWEGYPLIMITDMLATKQVAVLHLMEYFHVTADEIVAVGDSENDISMILAAGIGIAMGNSSEGLKSIAEDVAPSVSNDGVAAVIEKYFPTQ